MSTGTLFIVSTPLGNPDDITLRALKALKQCDIVVCEEVKEGARLLHEYHISKKIEQLNEHNESEQTGQLLALLKEGKNLALVSDCGTPLLADPGQALVEAAIGGAIPVVAIPGASSILTALVTSGLSMTQFLFAGFLSREPGQRKEQLRELAKEPRTIVLLETPYRLLPFLQALADIFPHRNAYLGCNLTLPSETHHYGTPAELLAKFEDNNFKGEFVLCLEGAGTSGSAVSSAHKVTKRENWKRETTPAGAARERGYDRPFRKPGYRETVRGKRSSSDSARREYSGRRAGSTGEQEEGKKKEWSGEKRREYRSSTDSPRREYSGRRAGSGGEQGERKKKEWGGEKRREYRSSSDSPRREYSGRRAGSGGEQGEGKKKEWSGEKRREYKGKTDRPRTGQHGSTRAEGHREETGRTGGKDRTEGRNKPEWKDRKSPGSRSPRRKPRA